MSAPVKMPIRGLTLYAVWAWCIAHLDKRVENRGWRGDLSKLKPRHVDRWIAIHAGANVGSRKGIPAADEECRAAARMARAAGWGAIAGQHFLPGIGSRPVPKLSCSRVAWAGRQQVPGGSVAMAHVSSTTRIGVAAPPALWGSLKRETPSDAMPIYTSRIVAVARISNLIRDPKPSGWYVGGDALGIVLSDVLTLPVPLPYTGAQGLFSIDEAARKELKKQYLQGTGKPAPFR